MGLEQDGVHPGIRVNAAGLGLHHLGAAHFLPQRGHAGVEGHVLRLERGHPVAVLKKNAAQGRREHAFSSVGAGALNHQGRFGQFAENGGAVSLQLGPQGLCQQGVFFRRADACTEPAAVFQPRIIGAVAQRDAVVFQEPGGQAGRRPRQAEEQEVGSGREHCGARQGGKPAEQVFPAFPVQGAFPVRP